MKNIIQILTDISNTNDGAICLNNDEITKAHRKAESKGLIQIDWLDTNESCIQITESGIRHLGEHTGSSEEDIQAAIDDLSNWG